MDYPNYKGVPTELWRWMSQKDFKNSGIEIPASPGIYMVIVVKVQAVLIGFSDCVFECHYVGQSINLKQRLANHTELVFGLDSEYGFSTVIFFETQYADRSDLLEIEKYFIKAYSPTKNIIHNGKRSSGVMVL